MHFIMPLMYPNRCDNEAFISETIDLTNVMKYLEKKNAEESYILHDMLRIKTIQSRI